MRRVSITMAFALLATTLATYAWGLAGTMKIQAPAGEVVPGSFVDVDVRVTSASQISALQFTLDYDSNVLQFTNATIGVDLPTGFQIYGVYTDSTFPPTIAGTNRVVVVQVNTYVANGSFTGTNLRVANLRFLVQPGYCRTSPLGLDATCNRTQLVTLQFQTICAANLQLQNGAATQRCISDATMPLASIVRLHPNTPNPFNPTTQIAFELAQESDVRLAVYAADGRLVRLLVSGRLAVGPHQATWDGRNEHGFAMASGVYRCRLQIPQGSLTQSMVLVR